MTSVLERFEAVGALYYRRYRQLRPGKDESPQTYRGQNADMDNVRQFSQWIKTLAFDDAIDWIVELERQIEVLRDSDTSSEVSK